MDTLFRIHAAESLSSIDHSAARRALLRVLVDPEEDTQLREACYLVLRRNLTPQLMKGYRWVEEMPRAKALKELATIHVGKLKSGFTPLKRYEPVLDSLQELLQHLDEKLARGEALQPPPDTPAPKPRTVERWPRERPKSDQPLPQAPPTKATRAAPAPPASGRQAGGERPKAGSDEGGPPSPPAPTVGYCFDCIQQMRGMGMLTEEQASEVREVPPSDCVVCS